MSAGRFDIPTGPAAATAENAGRLFFARPVLPLLGALAGGILTAAALPGHPLAAGAVATTALIASISALCRRRPALAAPLLLMGALGYLSLQPWVAPHFGAQHVYRFAGPVKWQISGTVASPPKGKKRHLRFILQVHSLSAPNRRVAATGRLSVTLYGRVPELLCGDRIAFRGRVRKIRNFFNPGGFDYQRYMAFKGVWVRVFAQAGSVTVLQRHSRLGFGRSVDKLRRGVFRQLQQEPLVFGSPDVRAVLEALLIGNRSGITPQLRMQFNRAGASHLLAISGLHIGIVAAAAFFVFRWLLAYSRFLLRRAWVARGAAVLALFPVVSYGLLAGMSASTQRAVVMVAVLFLALVAGRLHDLLNSIAWAAWVILIIYPPALFSVSFQLSFVAVGWIVFGLSNPALKQVLAKAAPQRPLRWILSLLIVSCLAVVGTLPLAMFYFNQASLTGILSNCLLVPLVGFAAVPLGLAGVALLGVMPAGALFFLNASAAAVRAGLAIIAFFARLPLSWMGTVTPSGIEIACYYLFLGALLYLGRSPGKDAAGTVKRAEISGGRDGTAGLRTLSIDRRALLAAAVAMLVFCADAGYWAYARFWHRDLRVTFLDVGQGSAAAVELPGGRVMMVDGGGFSDPDGFDVGARILAPFLWRKKICTVDTLVLSHPNSDHLNGLLFVADHFHVKEVWSNGQPEETWSYAAFRRIVKNRGIRLPAFDKLAREQHINGVQLQILNPPPGFMELRQKEHWRTVNNNSLVLRMAYGDFSFLFPGDIERPAEKSLLACCRQQLKSSVLLAPHHGSRSSSSPAFVDGVAPRVVVISCGWHNHFHFPHPRVLARYRRLGCRIFTTAANGAVTMRTDGRHMAIRPQRP